MNIRDLRHVSLHAVAGNSNCKCRERVEPDRDFIGNKASNLVARFLPTGSRRVPRAMRAGEGGISRTASAASINS